MELKSARGILPAEDPSEFTGHVIFYVAPEDVGKKRKSISSDALARLETILEKYGLSTERMRPLVTSVSAAQVARLEEEGRESPLPLPDEPRTLNSYWRLDARGQAGNADELVQDLTEGNFDAYREREVSEPAMCRCGNPFLSQQGYLKAAPDGIDALWMWGQCGGDGEGVAVIDVEEAWMLDHEDLVANRPWLISGDNLHDLLPPKGDHGTSVLGVLVAEDNQVGIVGIAPGVVRVGVASHFHAATNTHGHIADAIIKATSVLRPGDVILVEAQRDPLLPVEVDRADFDAILTAVRAGRVVVESGGNGQRNLDTFKVGGKFVLNRKKSDFMDSGAIVVGASNQAPPYVQNGTNFGSRIDCFAHGAGVTTAGGGSLTMGRGNPNAKYTNTFDGTSAAAAIVAGAAILVQGRFKALNGRPLLPLDMRTILSDANTGTKAKSTSEKMGVMPNLKKITETNPQLQRCGCGGGS